MSSFTCISCRVAFPDTDIQRGHYKSDWHRYNLKRKVAELPPVTAEIFLERVLAQRTKLAEDELDKSGHCKVCNKHYSTKNQYENHIRSKKHKDIEAKQQQKQEYDDAKKKKSGEKGIEDQKVLEKNAKNEAVKQTVEASGDQATSSQSGSSAGPSGDTAKSKVTVKDVQDEDDEAMDSDEESVEEWDGEALGLEECLFCSHISKDLEKNVNHMSNHHSFYIPDVEYLKDLEGLVVYLGAKVGEGHICLWCNEKGKGFTSTKAVQQHMLDKGHVKVLFEGDAVFEYSDFYDYRSSYPDFKEGEEVAAMEQGEGDEEEEEVDQAVMEEDNYQLVLPSGSTVGHRTLQRYYRQKLKPERQGRKLTPVDKIMAAYRGLGWTGTMGVTAERRAKDIQFVNRIKQKHHMRLSCKAHKLVKHMRDPNKF